jgi:hypothetical protein
MFKLFDGFSIEELSGFQPFDTHVMLRELNFSPVLHKRFQLALNHLFVSTKANYDH